MPHNPNDFNSVRHIALLRVDFADGERFPDVRDGTNFPDGISSLAWPIMGFSTLTVLIFFKRPVRIAIPFRYTTKQVRAT